MAERRSKKTFTAAEVAALKERARIALEAWSSPMGALGDTFVPEPVQGVVSTMGFPLTGSEADGPETSVRTPRRVFSKTARHNISVAQKRRFESPDARRQISEARGGIRERAFPWFVRGASVRDVAAISDITADQAANARRLLRADHRISRPGDQPDRSARSQAQLERNIDTQTHTHLIRIARALVTANLLSRDGDDFKQLEALYAAAERQLPIHFLSKVILEAYMKSLQLGRGRAIQQLEQALQNMDLIGQLEPDLDFLRQQFQR